MQPGKGSNDSLREIGWISPIIYTCNLISTFSSHQSFRIPPYAPGNWCPSPLTIVEFWNFPSQFTASGRRWKSLSHCHCTPLLFLRFILVYLYFVEMKYLYTYLILFPQKIKKKNQQQLLLIYLDLQSMWSFSSFHPANDCVLYIRKNGLSLAPNHFNLASN